MKTLLVIDVINMYSSLTKLGRGRLSYEKYLKSHENIVRAIAYGTDDPKTQNFVWALQAFGFETKFTFIRNKSTEISVDIFRMLDSIDCVVIGSTNLDLIPIIELLREKGKKVIFHTAVMPREFKNLAQHVEIKDDMLEKENEVNK